MNHLRPTPLSTTLRVLMLCCWAAVATAQEVSGTVYSEGHPIADATVQLLELDRLANTDARGRFRFTRVPSGTYRAFASAMGYASATTQVSVDSGATTISFNLAPSAVPLREVVVSASPLPRTTSEAYQSTASKARIDFLNSAGTSFAEKLSDLPGVTVRGNGSAPSRPILRGLSENEVLVLENGLRIGDIATYDPAHATPLEAIAISQVDVVRGPATVLYGPSTIGGLVNVITDIVPTVAGHPVSGTTALEGNSVSDEVAGYVNTIYSTDRQAFRVSAGGVHAQNIRIPTGTYTDPASGATFRLDRMPQTFDRSSEFGTGYAYQGVFGMFGIGGKHFEMNYGIPGVPPNPDFLTVPPTTSRIAQQRNTLEARGVLTVDGSFVKQWKLNASYNDYTHAEFPTAQDSSGVFSPQANRFHKREMNAVLQLQHQPIGRLQGTFGLWTNIEDLTIGGDQPLGPNSLTTGVAAYAYEEFQAAPAMRLQGGLRFDYNEIRTHPYAASPDSAFRTLRAARLSNAVTGSVGAIRQLTPEVTAALSVARSFRAPTVQELFANGLDAASGTYSIGSATLGPETGLGLDASLRASFASAAFDVSPYLNIIDQYIYGFLRGDTIQGFPVRQFAATRARLAGAELSLTVQPIRYVAVRASADYADAEDTRRHVPLPFTPPLRGLVRGTYQDNTYMATIEWRLSASQTRLGEGDTRTGGYAVVDLGTGIRLVQHGRVHHLSVHCDNVFNRVYRDHLSVIKDFLPQPGRGFRLNYELQY
jgi:iron complex outermembrane receptor protein